MRRNELMPSLSRRTLIATLAVLLAGLVGAGRASAIVGTVWTWGFNSVGELGDKTSTGPGTCALGPCSTVPVSVLGGATAIAGGYDHSLAVLSNGTVRAWGANEFGQLGATSGATVCGKGPAATPCRTVPVVVGRLRNVVAVAAGIHFSLALLSNGTVWAWGEDQFGQLGTGSVLGPNACDGLPCSTTPVMISGLSNVNAIAAGGDHALALLGNGTVMAWGLNGDGQLGDGTSTGPSTSCFDQAPCDPTPAPVTTPTGSPLSNVEAIAAGDAFSLALVRFTAGVTHVDAWGYNGEGQLGTGSTTGPLTCGISDPCSPYPAAVSGLSGTETAIAASGDAAQALALESDGDVAAWGDNEFGQAGSACATLCPSPKLVPGVSGATAISTSGGPNSFRSMALESGGHVAEWGTGPLGNGSFVSDATPIAVSNVSAPMAIAAGGQQSLAIALPPPGRFSITRIACVFCAPKLKLTLPYPGVLLVRQVPSPNPGPLAAGAADAAKVMLLVKPAAITVAQAGTVKVELKLTARGTRALRRQHELRFTLLITFTPNGGTPASQTITIKLKRKRSATSRR
jgi:alpha-tubulin suppressor-like RCC1 family protein